MSEQSPGIQPPEQSSFQEHVAALKQFGREILAAVVDSRPGFGNNLPITKDGKSLKEVGLESLGYRKNPETGEVEEIPPVGLDQH